MDENFKRGLECFRNRDYHNAIKHVNFAIDSNSQNYKAYHLKGASYFNLHEYLLAIENFTKALEYTPQGQDYDFDISTTHCSIAFSQKSLGKIKLAIENFTKAIEVNPNKNMYYERGVLYSIYGKHQEAINDFLVVIDSSPDHIDANYGLGVSYYSLEKYEEALEYFNKISEFRPRMTIIDDYKCIIAKRII